MNRPREFTFSRLNLTPANLATSVAIFAAVPALARGEKSISVYARTCERGRADRCGNLRERMKASEGATAIPTVADLIGGTRLLVSIVEVAKCQCLRKKGAWRRTLGCAPGRRNGRRDRPRFRECRASLAFSEERGRFSARSTIDRARADALSLAFDNYALAARGDSPRGGSGARTKRAPRQRSIYHPRS